MPQRLPSVPRRILVTTRAQDDDRAVVHYAGELAASLGAELILVGVAPIVPVGVTATYALAPFDFEAHQEEQDFADRMARANVDELASSLAPGLPKESVLTWGALGQATVDAAREHEADLVVVPMRRYDHGLGHALHDHADRYVLHHCDVPVLVVPTTS